MADVYFENKNFSRRRWTKAFFRLIKLIFHKTMLLIIIMFGFIPFRNGTSFFGITTAGASDRKDWDNNTNK